MVFLFNNIVLVLFLFSFFVLCKFINVLLVEISDVILLYVKFLDINFNFGCDLVVKEFFLLKFFVFIIIWKFLFGRVFFSCLSILSKVCGFFLEKYEDLLKKFNIIWVLFFKLKYFLLYIVFFFFLYDCLMCLIFLWKNFCIYFCMNFDIVYILLKLLILFCYFFG